MDRTSHLFLAALAALALSQASPAAAETFSPPKAIHVPGDPGARHHLLEREVIGREVIRVLTRREGTSRATFALREIDCPKDKVRLIGDGATEEAARHRLPSADTWTDLFPRSITWQIVRQVCG